MQKICKWKKTRKIEINVIENLRCKKDNLDFVYPLVDYYPAKISEVTPFISIVSLFNNTLIRFDQGGNPAHVLSNKRKEW